MLLEYNNASFFFVSVAVKINYIGMVVTVFHKEWCNVEIYNVVILSLNVFA